MRLTSPYSCQHDLIKILLESGKPLVSDWDITDIKMGGITENFKKIDCHRPKAYHSHFLKDWETPNCFNQSKSLSSLSPRCHSHKSRKPAWLAACHLACRLKGSSNHISEWLGHRAKGQESGEFRPTSAAPWAIRNESHGEPGEW